MEKVTGEQVKAAALAAGITRVDHHECGICGYMTAYIIAPDGSLCFDPGCDCCGGWLEARRWDDAAEWINMQSRDDVRAQLAKAFGLDA